MNKRICTMQDLSCVGQCSLTVALPILSHYGIETCVLPTAVLSNHTQFKSWSYLDLTDEIPKIYNEWEKSGIKFDGFILGYLGKKQLMELAVELFERFSLDNAPVVIDPVFADNGKLYGGFDMAYVEEMKKLIKHADIIDPNITEACFLTDTPYSEVHDKKLAEELAAKLAKITEATIIITGVEENGQIGELIFDGKDKKYVLLPKLNAQYHGTGDIFTSVMCARYFGGASLEESCLEAGKFVADCMRDTNAVEHFYGVNFERQFAKYKP